MTSCWIARALEGHMADHGSLTAARGITDHLLSPETPLRAVDTLLTGMHSPGESHYELLGAFAPQDTLRDASRAAERLGYRSHELGDVMLVGPGLSHPAGIRTPCVA